MTITSLIPKPEPLPIFRVFISGSDIDKELKEYVAGKIIEGINRYIIIEELSIRVESWYTPLFLSGASECSQTLIENNMSKASIFLGITKSNFGKYSLREWLYALYGTTKIKSGDNIYRTLEKKDINFERNTVFYYKSDIKETFHDRRARRRYKIFEKKTRGLEGKENDYFYTVLTFSENDENSQFYYKDYFWSSFGLPILNWLQEREKEIQVKLTEPVKGTESNLWGD